MDGLEIIKDGLVYFKEAPGIIALLLVIYWQRQTIKDLLKLGQEQAERSSKLLTLLEILVGRKEGK